MDTLLSICIPTYNRAPYLRSLLQSIRRQLGDGIPLDAVEIYVRNNASTDATEAILIEQAALLPNLRYTTATTNEGFDRNCFAVVQEARGLFCWLMGDDDDLTEGGLRTVLADVAGPNAGDLWLYDRIECDQRMEPRLQRRWSTVADGTRVRGNSQANLSMYLKSCHNLGGLFSFISSIVVRRECWRLPEMPSPFSYGYIHVFCCWQILADGGTLIVRRNAPVFARIPLPNTSEPSAIPALLLDMRGYFALSCLVARQNAALAVELLHAFRRGRPISTLLKVAVEITGDPRHDEFHRLMRDCGHTPLIKWLVMHPRLPLALHPIWRRTITPIRRLFLCDVSRYNREKNLPHDSRP